MTDLNRAAGHPLSETMLRFRHISLMPHPVRIQLAAVHQPLSAEEYSRLVDAVYEAHMASPPSPPSRHSCTCGSNRASQLVPVPPPGDAYAIHTMQATAVTGPGKPEAAAASTRDTAPTEARLASVEAALQRLEAALMSSSTSPRPRYCFYHARFGAEARNCQPPCEWLQSGNGSRGGRR